MAINQPNETMMSPAGRLAATLRSRHWTSFLLELILITLGILLALSIDAWIQDREDRKAEISYLRVLSHDLAQMSTELQQFLEFEAQNTNAGVEALQMLANDDYQNKANELRTNMWMMSSRRTLRLVSAAYTDLISTGNLQLIQSRSLRDLLLQYFAEVARVELVIEKNNTVFIDQTYFQYLLDMGIAWAPDEKTQVNAELRDATSNLLDLLNSNAAIAKDDLLAGPLDIETQASIRRMIVMRTRVSTVGQVLAGSLMEETMQLKAVVDDELASR